MGCRVKKAPTNKDGQTKLAFRLIFRGPDGSDVRSWEGTELEATPQNERLLNAKAVLIEDEIDKGTFNYLTHFPQGNKAALFLSFSAKTERKTIRQYHEIWKKDKQPPFVKKSRAQKYESHFNAYILPLHGDKYMHLYGFAEIRELRTDIVDVKKLKMKTAKNAINATLRAFFRDAKAEGVIEKNPFDDLPQKWWPRTPPPPPEPYTEQERDEILNYFKKKYLSYWAHGYAFLLSLFWSGCRPSELTARRWRDYDPRTGKLHIPTSRTNGEEGATKNNRPRTIPLLPPIRECLKTIRPLRARPDDYIFINQVGKPIDQKEFAERHFWPALEVLNLAKRDFYATRDTFISVMLSHGEPAQKVAEYCDTSVQMIEQSYGKYIGRSQEFGAAALAAHPDIDQIDLFDQRSLVNAFNGGKSEKTGEKISKVGSDPLNIPALKLVRGRGFEPPQS